MGPLFVVPKGGSSHPRPLKHLNHAELVPECVHPDPRVELQRKPLTNKRDTLVEWAILKPDFLDAGPEPAPVVKDEAFENDPELEGLIQAERDAGMTD